MIDKRPCKILRGSGGKGHCIKNVKKNYKLESWRDCPDVYIEYPD